MKGINLSVITDHLGALLVIAISALAAGALKTYLGQQMDAEAIKMIKKDHEEGLKDRYTGERARERNKLVDERFSETFERIAQMEGRHAGHD